METVKTKEDLVELLFQELDEAKPRQAVDPSFLLRLGGICHGLIYGGCEGEPPYLSDTLAILWRDREPTRCGVKLVAFAQMLAEEGCFDPTRVWTITRLIELMLAALDSGDLRVRCDGRAGARYVVSSQRFEASRGVRVRVKVGKSSNPPPANVRRVSRRSSRHKVA